MKVTMQEIVRVYHADTHSTDEVKQRLIQFWCILDEDIIDTALPLAGSRVVRIDPFSFLAGCRKRRLH